MKRIFGIATLIVAAASARSVAATTLISMIGDDDCFEYSALRPARMARSFRASPWWTTARSAIRRAPISLAR